MYVSTVMMLLTVSNMSLTSKSSWASKAQHGVVVNGLRTLDKCKHKFVTICDH